MLTIILMPHGVHQHRQTHSPHQMQHIQKESHPHSHVHYNDWNSSCEKLTTHTFVLKCFPVTLKEIIWQMENKLGKGAESTRIYFSVYKHMYIFTLLLCTPFRADIPASLCSREPRQYVSLDTNVEVLAVSSCTQFAQAITRRLRRYKAMAGTLQWRRNYVRVTSQPKHTACTTGSPERRLNTGDKCPDTPCAAGQTQIHTHCLVWCVCKGFLGKSREINQGFQHFEKPFNDPSRDID